MIIQKEILNIAANNKVKSFVIDKDWVLGHFLNAMFVFDDIKLNFVFKGGTCLKKCYFEDYRFSEDLDFTLLDSDFNVDVQLLQKIIRLAEENSGAKFHLKEIKPQIHKNIPQGYEVTILFWGADHKPNQKPLAVSRWQTKIKLDISFSEKVISKPVTKHIFHYFSDRNAITSKVTVYPINEIIAEKLRTLLQRNRPRDIYDLCILSEVVRKEEYDDIYKLLSKKSTNKNIEIVNVMQFVNNIKYRKNKRAWESSLGYHLPQGKLIDFNDAYKKVEQFVKNILIHHSS